MANLLREYQDALSEAEELEESLKVQALTQLAGSLREPLHRVFAMFSSQSPATTAAALTQLFQKALCPETSDAEFLARMALLGRLGPSLGVSKQALRGFFTCLKDCDEVGLLRGLRLLQMLLNCSKEQQGYFYFSGPGSGLNMRLKDEYQFVNSFVCCLWVRCEPAEVSSRLFTIYSRMGFGVECYIDGCSLWYRTLFGDYKFPDPDNPGIQVGELSTSGWNFVVVEHQKHSLKKDSLKVKVNDTEVHRDLQFKHKGQDSVAFACLGLDFSGQVQVAVFLKDTQSSDKYQELRELPLSQWSKYIRVFGKDVVFLLHPERQGDDAVRFLPGSGVTPWRHRRMANIGGLEALIPLLQLDGTSEEVLKEWLKLVIICVACENPTDLETTQFFAAAAACFAELPGSIFAAPHIAYLEQLEKQLPVKTQLVREILWAFDVWLNTSEEVVQRHLRFLRDLYAEHAQLLSQIFGVEELRKLLAEHLSFLEYSFESVLLDLLEILERLIPHDAKGVEVLLDLLVTSSSETIKQKALSVLFGKLNSAGHASKDVHEIVIAKCGTEVLADCLQKSVDTDTILLVIQCISLITESQSRSIFTLTSPKIISFINASLLPKLAMYQADSSLRAGSEDREPTAEFGDCLGKIEELKAVRTVELVEGIFALARECSLQDQLEVARYCYEQMQDDLDLVKLLCHQNHWYDWFLSLLNTVPEEDEQVLEPLLDLHTYILNRLLVTESTGWKEMKHCFDLIETKASQSPHLFLLLVENLRCSLQLSVDSKDFRRPSIIWRNLVMISFAIQESLHSKPVEVSHPLLALNQLTKLLRTSAKVEGNASQWLLSANTQAGALQNEFFELQSQAAAAAQERSRNRRNCLRKTLKRLCRVRGPWHSGDPVQCEISQKSSREHGKLLLKPSSSISYRIKPQSAVEIQELKLPKRMRLESFDSFENDDDSSVESEDSRSSLLVSPRPESSLATVSRGKVTVTVGWMLPIATQPGFLQLVNMEKNPVIRFCHDELADGLLGIEICGYEHPLDKAFAKDWPVELLIEVVPKTYIMRHTAAEFIYADGQTATMNFASQAERRHFMEQLQKVARKGLFRLGLFRHPCPRKLVQSLVTDRWRNWEISNFEYLLYLNKIAGRSFNDLTQYCVMPWVLADYSSSHLDLSNPAIYRDLSRNMGQCGTASRQENLWNRYKHSFGPEDVPYFFGSHYSSPGIVLNFLIRLLPYSEGAKALQGGNFDLPDRVFKSVLRSFVSVLEDSSDVRELIPEFFSNPEFLINRNHFDFGHTQEGEQVNHVELPAWASSPYEFIRLNRLALESDIVSSKLHQWIDLIFGYKQRGEEAIKHMNVFHIMTYEGAFDLDREEIPHLRKAYETQIAHFGKTPSQLFREPHPPRKHLFDICSWRTVLSPNAQLYPSFAPGKRRKTTSDCSPVTSICAAQDCTNFYVARGNSTISEYLIELASSQSGGPYGVSCSKEYTLKWNCDSPLDPVDWSVGRQPTVFLASGKGLIQGGYWNGQLLCVFQRKSKLQRTKWECSWVQAHSTTVTCIDATKSESTVVTGAKDGSLCVWKQRNSKLELLWEFFDHDEAATSVAVEESLHLFASCSRDGTCNLYSLSSGRLMNSLDVCCYSTQLLFGPAAPAKLVVISKAGRKVMVYSVAGDLVWEQFVDDQISCAMIAKDLTYNEFLVYGTEAGTVKVRSTADFSCLHEVCLYNGLPVSALSLSRNILVILTGLDNGEVGVVVDSESIVKLMEKRMQDAHHALSHFHTRIA